MESLIYNSAWYDIIAGNVNVKSGTVKCMLVTDRYSPNKKSHSRRSHVGNEVVSAGYIAGGTIVVASTEINKSIDRIYLILGDASWPYSTITADAAVYYNSHGGAAADDELLAFIAFSERAISINDKFLISESRMWIDNSQNLVS